MDAKEVAARITTGISVDRRPIQWVVEQILSVQRNAEERAMSIASGMAITNGAIVVAEMLVDHQSEY